MPSRRERVTVYVEGLGALTLKPLSSARLKRIEQVRQSGTDLDAALELLRRSVGGAALADMFLSSVPAIFTVVGAVLEASEPAPPALVAAMGDYAVRAARALAQAPAGIREAAL